MPLLTPDEQGTGVVSSTLETRPSAETHKPSEQDVPVDTGPRRSGREVKCVDLQLPPKWYPPRKKAKKKTKQKNQAK